MIGAQFRPFSYKALGFCPVGSGERVKFGAGFIDGLPSDGCAFVEAVGSDVGCADGLEVGSEFGFGVGERFAGRVDGLGVVGSLSGESSHFVERDLFYEGVGFGEVDCCGCFAGSRRVPFAAPVVDVSAFFAGCLDHYVAAPGASDDSGEEAWWPVGAGFAGSVAGLGGVELGFGDDGGVRFGVGVLADAEFSKIDAVAEEVSYAAGGHLEAFAECAGCGSVGEVSEGLADQFGVLVGGEASGLGVSVVAPGGLAALPDSALGGGRPEFFEAFSVEIEFVFGYGGEHCSGEASGGCRCVDVFVDGDYLPSGLFDAVPRFEKVTDAAACSAEVGDDQAPVLALFDAFDGLVQDWAVGVPAASIEFGGKDLDGFVTSVRPRLYRRGLVFGAAETVPAALSDERDSYVTGPGFHAGEDNDYAQSNLKTPRDAIAQEGEIRCANAR